MKLNDPFKIGARLLPALQIGDSWLSMEWAGFSEDRRAICKYHIDTPQWSYTGDDLKSGVGGGSLQDMFAGLLSFLGACAESRAYQTRTGRAGENADLFPDYVGEWAEMHSDELSMLACELEERADLICD